MTIKDLLESEFLQREKLRVELTRPVSDILDENLSVLPLRLKGQLSKHSQDEAIEFDYKIDEDDPDTLAAEMVSLRKPESCFNKTMVICLLLKKAAFMEGLNQSIPIN